MGESKRKMLNATASMNADVEKFKGISVALILPGGSPFTGDVGYLEALDGIPRCPFPVLKIRGNSSSLTGNFNTLWCMALNARKEYGITHVCMLHNDIAPRERTFLQDMLTILMAHPTWSMLSAIVPIKDHKGLTSSGWDTHRWAPRRITMTETYRLPETFGTDTDLDYTSLGITGKTAPLIANTGLMLCDIRTMDKDKELWAEKICFEFRNAITWIRDDDGSRLFRAYFEPEDWRFSRRLHELGVNFGLTRKIPLSHGGQSYYPNTNPWGDWKTDTLNRQVSERFNTEYSTPCIPNVNIAINDKDFE